MLFWAFLTTTLVYVGVGVMCAVCLRMWKRGVGIAVPFLFLVCGELKVLLGDAVACELINSQCLVSSSNKKGKDCIEKVNKLFLKPG